MGYGISGDLNSHSVKRSNSQPAGGEIRMGQGRVGGGPIPPRKRKVIPSRSDKQEWAGAGPRGPTRDPFRASRSMKGKDKDEESWNPMAVSQLKLNLAP
jgi:hypothetical protein